MTSLLDFKQHLLFYKKTLQTHLIVHLRWHVNRRTYKRRKTSQTQPKAYVSSVQVCSLPDHPSSFITNFTSVTLLKFKTNVVKHFHSAINLWQLNENAKSLMTVCLSLVLHLLYIKWNFWFCVCVLLFKFSHVISMLRKAWIHHKSVFPPPELQPLAKP